MKILISGSGGFVGHNLAMGLAGKFELFIPRSKELDFTDEKALRKYIKKNNITHVVHAAVHSGIFLTREAGFQGDLRMLVNLMRNLDILEKIIVFGSGAEYAKTRDIHKVKEEEWGEYVPRDLYGLAKFLTTEIVRREPKMVNLRLFGIYGPYEEYQYKFISNSIVKNLLGMPIRIKQDVVFDYLYIDDLLPVVEHFLINNSRYRDYNVSTLDSIRLTQIAKLINKIADRQSLIEVVNRGLNFEYTGSNDRLCKEMPGWQITSYEVGIRRLYNYYKSIKDSLNRREIEDDHYLQKAQTKA